MTPHFMHAAMTGMVILILPAFVICTAITVMAYRRRNQCVEDERPGPEDRRPDQRRRPKPPSSRSDRRRRAGVGG